MPGNTEKYGIPKSEYRARSKESPLEAIEPLIIERQNGDKIIIEALGYSMEKPAIDFVKHTTFTKSPFFGFYFLGYIITH